MVNSAKLHDLAMFVGKKQYLDPGLIDCRRKKRAVPWLVYTVMISPLLSQRYILR